MQNGFESLLISEIAFKAIAALENISSFDKLTDLEHDVSFPSVNCFVKLTTICVGYLEFSEQSAVKRSCISVANSLSQCESVARSTIAALPANFLQHPILLALKRGTTGSRSMPRAMSYNQDLRN